MIWVVYYLITVIATIIIAISNTDIINISIYSVIPLILIAISAFQAFYHYNNRSKIDFNSGNNSPLLEKEWNILSVYMSFSFVFFIPLMFPFVVFFPTPAKALSLILYFLAFISGNIYFRLKYGNAIKSRLDDENKSLTEQLKKEEMGKLK